MTLLIIAIYLVGCALGYISLRAVIRRDQGEWKKSDRSKCLFLSFLLSWVMALVMGLELLMSQESDGPASW